MQVVEVFKVNFFGLFAEKYGKGLQVPYASKNRLVALVRQVSHGPCKPKAMPDIGILDVIGSDRRLVFFSKLKNK